ncbi:hypothetical protein E2C01_079122 [Portunus trituberculatus]|uniref:Uncharacterized protein n=1 Tax=Portunus trituberculatus TaxID=210409 RepID=A0A5B7IPS9_PORTR|nr:hypothetical protein [Portunus trituberculatus]
MNRRSAPNSALPRGNNSPVKRATITGKAKALGISRHSGARAVTAPRSLPGWAHITPEAHIGCNHLEPGYHGDMQETLNYSTNGSV